MRNCLRHPRLQRKQVCTGSSALNQWGPRAGLGTDLLRLHEVGHMAVVVHASGVEASAGALAADAGDEAGLGLLVRGVHRADGHHPADDLQQPVTAAYLVLPQGHVQQLVPAKQPHSGSGCLTSSRKHCAQSKSGRCLGAAFPHCTLPMNSALGTHSLGRSCALETPQMAGPRRHVQQERARSPFLKLLPGVSISEWNPGTGVSQSQAFQGLSEKPLFTLVASAVFDNKAHQ